MASEKEPIHWDWIEREWQRGALSNVQIAKLHEQEFGRKVDESSIRLRVSQYGWQRDLSEAIRRETRQKIARGELRGTPRNNPITPNSESDVREAIEHEEARIVDVASDALVRVDSDQRVKLARSSVLADYMEAYALSMLTVDKDGRPDKVYEPGELKDLVSAASNAVATRLRVIATERKIYGMDAPKGSGEHDSSGLSDAERTARIIALLDRGRARRDGQTAEQSSADD